MSGCLATTFDRLDTSWFLVGMHGLGVWEMEIWDKKHTEGNKSSKWANLCIANAGGHFEQETA